MATATTEIERIVRKVLSEEQDETMSAIRELSTLLTEQIIPRLSDGADRDDDDAESGDERDVMSMSVFDGDTGTRRRGKPLPNGHDEGDTDDLPEQEIPPAAIEAFTAFYHTLSSEQASALAQLFTVVDSEIDNQGQAHEGQDEDQDEQDDDEVRVHA